MEVFIVAISAGVLSGIISPFIVSWLQHKWIWKNQKRLEIKYAIFNDAIKALSLKSVDSLDPKLQSEKTSFKGMQRQIELRPETQEIIEKSRGLVKAFFSDEAFSAFKIALETEISMENIPNEDFEKNRVNAIVCLSKELGIK